MRIRRCSLLILTGILVWPYTQAGVQSPDVSPGAISIYISRGGIYMARVYHTRLMLHDARCTMHIVFSYVGNVCVRICELIIKTQAHALVVDVARSENNFQMPPKRVWRRLHEQKQ